MLNKYCDRHISVNVSIAMAQTIMGVAERGVVHGKGERATTDSHVRRNSKLVESIGIGAQLQTRSIVPDNGINNDGTFLSMNRQSATLSLSISDPRETRTHRCVSMDLIQSKRFHTALMICNCIWWHQMKCHRIAFQFIQFALSRTFFSASVFAVYIGDAANDRVHRVAVVIVANAARIVQCLDNERSNKQKECI